MSMQDRLVAVKRYLKLIGYLLACINKTKDSLTKLASTYTSTLVFEETDNGRKVFERSLDKIVFVTMGQGYEGKILFTEGETIKGIPVDPTYLGTTLGGEPYINLDDLIYIAINLNAFSEYIVREITKVEMESVIECINELKESAVADLL